MDKKTLKQIKDNLLEEKSKLEKELSQFTTKDSKNSDNYIAKFEDYGDDKTDNTSEVAKYNLNLTLEKTLEKALKDVNKALEKIDNNKYNGKCKYCKQEINPKRLLARPTSNSCISCKTKLKSL